MAYARREMLSTHVASGCKTLACCSKSSSAPPLAASVISTERLAFGTPEYTHCQGTHPFAAAKGPAAICKALLSLAVAAARPTARMSQQQRRAVVAAGAAASILLYFYKRRQAPEGATLIKGVLDEEECKTLETLLRDLLKNAASLPGKTYSPVTHPNFVKRNQSRETLQFGAYVDKNRVQNACVAPLPPPLLRVARKLKKLGIVQQTPDACCVNFYSQGQWLPDHVDSKKFERPLVTVSLGSEQCVLFKRRGYLARCIRLPVGSALRLDGAAADDWTHGLPPATSPRISLTFRRLNAETKSKFADEARRVKERRDEVKDGPRRHP
jgi:alkylated DNA repair dioxygenase AlkB